MGERAHKPLLPPLPDGGVSARVDPFTREGDFGWVADLLSARRDEILERWLECAAAQPFHAGRREHAVTDHIPPLFDALVMLLRRAAPPGVGPGDPLEDPAVLEAAREHARARFQQGLTAPEVATEFRILRQEIGRALRLHLSDATPTRDVISGELLVNDALDGAVFLALTALNQHEEARRRAEAALRESEERFRLFVEAVTDYAMYLLDPDGRISSWNRGAERIKGYAAEEVIGQPYSIFFVEEDRLAGVPEQLLSEAVAHGRVHAEGWRRRKDGRRLWVEGALTALLDADGQLRGFAKVTRDVTGRRVAEQALRTQAELLDLTHDAIFVWELRESDSAGRITYWNRAAEQLYGYSQREALGRVSHELLQTQLAASSVHLIEAALEQTGVWCGELVHTTRDSRQILVESRHRLVTGADGRRLVLESSRDITGQRALAAEQAQLFVAERQARAEAEGALRLRDEVLAAVSHDLKTPLTTISGAAQVLARRITQGNTDPERLLDGLDRIRGAAARMAAIMDELVDAALLERGQPLTLRPERVDLVALVSETVADHQAEATGHTLQMEAVVPTLWGEWDCVRLRRILDNLLANAVKYSPGGGTIEVRVAQEEHAALVAVRDFGLGIPARDLPHLFERFRRASNVGQIPGAGIGLAAAQQIAQQHGGRIEVASTEGRGSLFTLRLPLGVGEANPRG